MRRAARIRASLAFAGLTPLVDTLFILLFALLALSDARTSHATELVRVRLPEVEPASDSPAPGAATHALLEVASDSSVHVPAVPGEGVRTREELDAVLARLLEDRVPEEVVVEIHADRGARHGVVVELLQHLRLRGFVDVQLIAVGHVEPAAPFGGGGGER